jgi:hypothetical protein
VLAREAGAVLTFISLTGWDTFQHYKDRDPPWIKLYRDILTTESWVLGSDTSRLVQVASMLLAVRYKNRIPLNWPLLKKVASLDCSEKQFMEAISHLAASKFLTVEKDQTVTSESESLLQSASTALATCPSDQIRSEESREETEQIRTSVELKLDGVPRGTIERVFDHWKSEYRHPKASLDPKRRKAIQRALESYDEPTLLASISGYKLSPHHMGQNDQRTVYDDISLFLRDAEHIDRGLNFARAPPARVQSAVETARARLQERMNGNGRVVSEQSGGSGDSGVGSLVGALR